MKVLILFYLICAVALTFYGINCHIMTLLFRRGYPRVKEADSRFLNAFYDRQPPEIAWEKKQALFPKVTTQLPIYNEKAVAVRLIDAVSCFLYPDGKHEIQVLDDSTDETREIIAQKVACLRENGVNIHHITRKHRQGYKAGALREGLAMATGQCIAIFDADFIPPPDFLIRTIPFFIQDPKIGFIQSRWGHINSGESLITRLQSIGINGHFMIEQTARYASNLYLNFNGTAGVFRKQAIIEAGNWQDDTLTEDMDLSYRIQLAGWTKRYVPDLVAPAEIPSNINAFKSQQFRWAKGSIQTAIKLMPRVFQSSIPFFTKFQAFMHMTHYMVHPLMLFLAVTAPLVILYGRLTIPPVAFLVYGSILFVSCSGPSFLYFTAERTLRTRPISILLWLPVMIAFGCGQAINNTLAVMEAIFRKPSGFVRTPKKGLLAQMPYVPNCNRVFLLEIIIGIWCLAGTVLYFQFGHFLVGHFLLIYTIGFCFIGTMSWVHGRRP